MKNRVLKNGLVALMITLGIAALSITISKIVPKNNEQQSTENEVKESSKKLPTISMDSLLNHLNTCITLWTESKDNYEILAQDTLERIGSERCEFIADISGIHEFGWPAIKDHMNWVGDGSRLKIFNRNLWERFVVIGYYYGSPDGRILHFTGDLYKY